jgi:hypothetical protein
MVKESIGGDLEYQSAFALSPRCARHGAQMLVPLGRGAFDGEGAKAMLSAESARRCGEAPEIERFRPNQLATAAKRG